VTYHAVESQHLQPHLNEHPDFEALSPTVNVNIATDAGNIQMEWDVISCDSFVSEAGKWIKLRPGHPIPN